MLTARKTKRILFKSVLYLVPNSRITKRLLYDFIKFHLACDTVCTRTISNIIVNAHREGIWLLEHHTNVTAKLVYIHILIEYIATVIANLARDFYNRDKVVHAVKGFKKCGLAASGRADQRRDTLFGNSNIYIF